MEELPKRNKKPRRKDGFPWKSLIAVVVIVSVVLAVAEMARIDREYRLQANRQAIEALEGVTQDPAFQVRQALERAQASDAALREQVKEESRATTEKN
ncbi:hypothetical protein [Stenotrophomonas geniculata]|uniref:hypothetical protein n=1 Tax=Stenotrophomonas geniculata TaxID=86188 RepID=UPI000709DBE4|nr:hypothetical protein [Stenotrophomonas geniculata]KRG37319.1 hypothetical protein ARC63_19955 [Stenotrophomonas geniculata ATCC 19374 = JCM 13324]